MGCGRFWEVVVRSERGALGDSRLVAAGRSGFRRSPE